MQRLLLLLFKYRAFLAFLVMEFVCGWLIVQNNNYQNAAFFNSSNRLAANILYISSEISSYFSLKRTNRELSMEIARLRDQLEKSKRMGISTDTIQTPIPDMYEFITSKVINNSVSSLNNYLTINKGERDSIKPGMGVIGGGGIVGKVKYTSANYSVVTSVLHSEFLISSKVIDKVTLCSTQWDGRDPYSADLLFVPRHINLEVGDTVVTSGFNSIFPENIMIGIVSKVELNEESTFYNAKLDLVNDFRTLTYVHVINNKVRQEKDSLENQLDIE